MSWGSTWRLVTIGKGQGRKEIGLLGTGKRAGGRHYRGKRKPRRVEPTGLVVGNLVDQLPARALRRRSKVKRRQSPRYPMTRRRGFMVQRRTWAIVPSGRVPEANSRAQGFCSGGV